MKKIAITGISGHIGNNVARVLLKKGHSLNALVQNPQSPAIQDIDATYVQGDMFNEQALDSICKDADLMLHIAGKISLYSSDKKEIYKVNIEGVKNVIEACKRNNVRSIIHFSSIHAHIPLGFNKAMNEETPYVDSEEVAYDYSKSIGEQLMLAARKEGINVCIVNPTAVLGPFDFQPSLSGKMIIDIYSKKMPSIVKGGFDWIDVRDIAEAVASIIEKEVQNEKFILSGKYVELKEVADLICAEKGEKYKGFTSSLFMAKIGLPFIAFWAFLRGSTPLYTKESIKAIEEASNINEHDHASKLIEYQPRPLKETIADSIRWFQKHKYL
jgi:dihydroflavonol-4-reductase